MEHVGREIFWNVGQTARWFAYALMVISFILIIYGIKTRYRMWKIGKADAFVFTHRLAERIGYYIKSAIFHRIDPALPRIVSGVHAPLHLLGVSGPCRRHGPRRLRG